jgi:hypothetical protein
MKRSSVAAAVALLAGLPLVTGLGVLFTSGCGLIIGLGDREPLLDASADGHGDDSGSDAANGPDNGSSGCTLGMFGCDAGGSFTCCVEVIEMCTSGGCVTCSPLPDAGPSCGACLPVGSPCTDNSQCCTPSFCDTQNTHRCF